MYTFKILSVGDYSTGKTSLINRYSKNLPPQDNLTTIGVDFGSKIIEKDNQKIKMMIWDIVNGGQRYYGITQMLYRQAFCILIQYDVSKRDTLFEGVPKWNQRISQFCEEKSMRILVGNKADLKEREVSYEEGLEYARQNNMEYFETSALTGYNVEELFSFCGTIILEKIHQSEIDLKPEVNN